MTTPAIREAALLTAGQRLATEITAYMVLNSDQGIDGRVSKALDAWSEAERAYLALTSAAWPTREEPRLTREGLEAMRKAAGDFDYSAVAEFRGAAPPGEVERPQTEYPKLWAHLDNSEVRLHTDSGDYKYMVRVTPGHAEPFCKAVNDAIRAALAATRPGAGEAK
jgi:hypothetical protein